MRWLPLLLLASLVAPVGAQRASQHPSPDCNLAERRRDGPWTMRRYEWHALGFAEGVGGAIIARKVLRLPKLASLSIAPTVTIVLHMRQKAHGATPNYPDWVFDAVLRAAPAFYQLGKSGNTWQSKTLAVTSVAAGYLAGACFLSP